MKPALRAVTGTASDPAAEFGAFLQALREFGWVEGQNILIGRQYAEPTLQRTQPERREKVLQLIREAIEFHIDGLTDHLTGSDQR